MAPTFDPVLINFHEVNAGDPASLGLSGCKKVCWNHVFLSGMPLGSSSVKICLVNIVYRFTISYIQQMDDFKHVY